MIFSQGALLLQQADLKQAEWVHVGVAKAQGSLEKAVVGEQVADPLLQSQRLVVDGPAVRGVRHAERGAIAAVAGLVEAIAVVFEWIVDCGLAAGEPSPWCLCPSRCRQSCSC